MALQSGLSGLNAAAKSLDVISNNVSNGSTVGFKLSSSVFSDLFASAINGAASSTQVGIGTSISKVAQQFSQGNISTSSNPLDMAINGDGFFRLSDAGTISFTRNGQFQLDKNGYVSSSSGLHLTGYGVDANGKIVAGPLSDIRVNNAILPPVATGQSSAGTGIEIQMNFNAADEVKTDSAGTAVATFNQADGTTYNFSTSVSVYDQSGAQHSLGLFFQKQFPGTSTTDWKIYTSVDGGTASTTSQTLTFDNTTGKVSGTGLLSIDIDIDQSVYTAPDMTAVPLNFTGSTQYSGSYAVNSSTQDGYAAGQLSGIAIDATGVVKGKYSNGQTTNLGQVVLAHFADPGGLQSAGGNLWSESAASGQPQVGAPGTGQLGAIQSGALEDSNVDLTAELVNMITAQRNYQANAQSIKTQDQLMQTLVNLR